jgi:hypothetical protein
LVITFHIPECARAFIATEEKMVFFTHALPEARAF